jgi:hypothetical protein
VRSFGDTHWSLADDHARAERVAEGLRAIDALSLTQDTNMVWVMPPAEYHNDLVAHLESVRAIRPLSRP